MNRTGRRTEILYVDEVNLLDDHLVNLLLDAATLGVNYGREDLHSHPAEFILVGTMNPKRRTASPVDWPLWALCQIEGETDPR